MKDPFLLVPMKVPAWFKLVGIVSDSELAKELGIPTNEVRHVRHALGLRAQGNFRNQCCSKTEGERRVILQQLKVAKVPRKQWNQALGFRAAGGLDAEQWLREWLHCVRHDLPFDELNLKLAISKKTRRLSRSNVAVQTSPLRPLPLSDQVLLEVNDDPDEI